ncbi:ExbD/TolR family protein [Aurantiacibacter aquimixticola]|uniref:Biopolymer transporter ExbD n=1 Tax=Aurantiacibacter aquimixticola TaxID=1958945 RepID=A0A419RW37_9SPHN|nr:biopolymer transporter ExbD [Aurantiacibacter aquimixticola]RJY09977.1 biopolymer transporter ExbD [Aurantiacibacter aquimixticola]
MAMNLASSGARRGRRASRRAPMAEINVTPFVDVMLVLLIIFMVTAPLLASGVPVDLPESRADPLDQEPDQITVAIDREGFVYVDDTRIERGALPQALESLAGPEGAQRPSVNLRADRNIDWGRAMAVMGELNRAGFSQISLVTTGSAEAP